MLIHELLERNILCLVDLLKFVFVLFLFLLGFFVAIEVDGFDRGQPLLSCVFPFFVSEGHDPLLISITLLLKHAI